MTEEGFIQEDWMLDAAGMAEEPGGGYAPKQYSFEQLTVWARAVDLVEWTYKATSGFPGEERFILTSQIRRAALSAPSNIAEGMSRRSARERAHFIQIAYGSLLELLNHLIIAQRLGFLPGAELTNGRQWIQELTAMLSALRKAIKDNS